MEEERKKEGNFLSVPEKKNVKNPNLTERRQESRDVVKGRRRKGSMTNLIPEKAGRKGRSRAGEEKKKTLGRCSRGRKKREERGSVNRDKKSQSPSNKKVTLITGKKKKGGEATVDGKKKMEGHRAWVWGKGKGKLRPPL